jgi:hypothetical protein
MIWLVLWFMSGVIAIVYFLWREWTWISGQFHEECPITIVWAILCILSGPFGLYNALLDLSQGEDHDTID